jgi:hypothetical protein
MLSIFLRLLEKVIADSSWAAEVDLSDVVLMARTACRSSHRRGGALWLANRAGSQFRAALGGVCRGDVPDHGR